jgi:hypothetical protein
MTPTELHDVYAAVGAAVWHLQLEDVLVTYLVMRLKITHSRFPTGRRAARRERRTASDQEVRSACGSVTVPRFSRAARVAQSKYAFGSTPQSLADSMRL